MKTSLCILLLMLTAAGCRSSTPPQPEQQTPVAVSSTVAATRRVPRTFEAGGVVRARRTATLSSRITAPVLSIQVTAGDRVRSGQPIATLDAQEIEADLARAAADVVVRERAHAAAAAEHQAAEAGLRLARASHQRISALHARDSATAQELDEALSTLNIAEARLTASEAQVAGAAAALDAARQAENGVRAAASYARLAAPFDGLITERLVDPGTLATPGLPLLRIEEAGHFRLEVPVDESRLASVKGGAPVDVLLNDGETDDESGVWLNGTVSEISRAVESGNHTFLVKIDLPTRPFMRSGMFGRARFSTGSEELLTVPPGAIVAQGQLSTVFVVSTDQRAHMRVIDTGSRGADWVEVLAGLSAGEHVIVSPAGVRDGIAVRTSAATDARP